MMKRFGMSACALMFVVGFQQSCVAQANPWDGSYKADRSTYKYSGSSFSVVTDADGFTTTRDGKAQPKVVCDGQPHSADDVMMTCTKAGNGYALSTMKGDKVTRKQMISISADGKTRTSKAEVFPPEGPSFTMTAISKRVSGGPGAAGDWKETDVSSSTEEGMLTIAVKGDTIDFKETDGPKPVNCKLDGTPTPFPLGGSVSIKLADPHTLKVVYSDEKGVARRENTFALSADGKSITETDVTPAPSPSKMTIVLRKTAM